MFLLRNYFAGAPKAGDRFTFQTNPAATLVKAPVLFLFANAAMWLLGRTSPKYADKPSTVNNVLALAPPQPAPMSLEDYAKATGALLEHK